LEIALNLRAAFACNLARGGAALAVGKFGWEAHDSWHVYSRA
jgi:hypothetical protein